jgi:hypothetical protein
MNLDPIEKIGNKRIDEFLEMSNIGATAFRAEMQSKRRFISRAFLDKPGLA